MRLFARHLATWIVAVFFAAASVAWASTEPLSPASAPDRAAIHAAHDHAHAAGSDCEPATGCAEDDGHGGHTYGADADAASCCAFACHVIAEPSPIRPQAAVPPASCEAGREPAALVGADPLTLERPPRAG